MLLDPVCDAWPSSISQEESDDEEGRGMCRQHHLLLKVGPRRGHFFFMIKLGVVTHSVKNSEISMSKINPDVRPVTSSLITTRPFSSKVEPGNGKIQANVCLRLIIPKKMRFSSESMGETLIFWLDLLTLHSAILS